MKIHNVIQGSAEWLALRALPNVFTASDAAALMGASPYTSRAELLRRKATGIVEEVSEQKQALFDRGHATEAAFRPIAEEMLDGDDLFPVTGSIELEGLVILASFDGLTLSRQKNFEHKLFNNTLAKMIEADGEPGPAWYWQLEHQLLVMEHDVVVVEPCQTLFVTSDGTRDCMAHCFYESKPERRAQLIAAWKLFAEDLAAYKPEPPAAAQLVGRTPDNLPALHVEISGQVRASNLKTVREHATEALRNINRTLTTDQHFADAEKTVKWCEDLEARVEAAKKHALSQTADIESVFRLMDDIKAETRTVRLELANLVKARKEAIRGEIVAEAATKLREHMGKLATSVGMPVPMPPADFGGAIKGKKSIQSMRDALGQVLADAKMAASDTAHRIAQNLRTLEQHAGLEHLFADRAQLVLKMPEDMQAVVTNRVTEHLRKEEQRQEQERERIRAEEQAKAEKDAREAIEREQAQRRADLKAIRGWYGNYCTTLESVDEGLAKIAAWTASPTVWGDMIDDATAAVEQQRAALVTRREFLLAQQAETTAAEAIKSAATPASAPAVVAQPLASTLVATQKSAPVSHDEKATMKIGDICARLRFTVTADFLAELGFVAVVDKGTRLYPPSLFPAICTALIEHLNTVADEVPA